MVPDIDGETHRLTYRQAKRTVTDNHVQQFYTFSGRECFVQCEEEYHTVKGECAGPCDSDDWVLVTSNQVICNPVTYGGPYSKSD